MSTRRGWQATVGELNAVRRHLDVAQGADAQVRDGQLWLRPHPQQPWVAAVRIPAALAARARRWVAAYVAAATQGAPPVTASPASPWCSRSPRSRLTPPRELHEKGWPPSVRDPPDAWSRCPPPGLARLDTSWFLTTDTL